MKTIAVDIDDVLAANAEGFVAWSNRKWGTNLTVDDYDEHWGQLWDVDIDETRRRSLQLHQDRIMREYRHDPSAKAVLESLAERYRLVIVTSRPKIGQQDTTEWIDLYFKGIFQEIYFAGMWDEVTEASILGTKADICQQIGADYLIDDQLKHCLAVAQVGISAILFGDYAWNQVAELSAGVTRCADWVTIKRYFSKLDLV